MEPEENLPETATERLQIVEERLSVGTREEERVVRVHQRPVERTERVSLSLQSQELELERVRIDRFVDEIPPVRYEGDVAIIPVVEEVVVVRLKLVEEVRVSRRARTRVHQENVVLRRTEVELEDLTETA